MKNYLALLTVLILIAAPAFAATCDTPTLPTFTANTSALPDNAGQDSVFSINWISCGTNASIDNAVLELTENGVASNHTMTLASGTDVNGVYTYTAPSVAGTLRYRFLGSDNSTDNNADSGLTSSVTLTVLTSGFSTLVAVMLGVAVLVFTFFPVYNAIKSRKINVQTLVTMLIYLIVGLVLMGTLLTLYL